MACQTITGLLLAATALLHGCASAPAEAEPSVAGGMDPSPASLGPDAALPGAADASPSVVPQPGGGGKPALEPLPAEAAPAQPIVVVESGPAERSGIGVERPETLESPESLGSSGPLPADESSGEGGPGPEAPTGLEAPEAVAETGDLAPESAPSVETADGLTMQFEVIGQGRPVVLIHGWCGNGEQWAATASALARSYRVYSVDLVGHGASAAQARTRWTIASYGDDVARLLEREGLREAVLIGHSMGGPVALEAAVRAPDRDRKSGV